MSQRVKEIIEIAGQALKDAERNHELVQESVKQCSKQLIILRGILRCATTPGVKQSATSSICLVQGYRTMLKKLHFTTGAGLERTANRTNWSSLRIQWKEVESAFSGRASTGVIINLLHKDPKIFLKDCSRVFERIIKKPLTKLRFVKVNAIFCGEFRIIKSNEELNEFKFMNTKNVAIYPETDIGEWFMENIESSILKKLVEFQERDSGWALSAIVNLAININKFTPQLGSSYIPLPDKIRNKKACVNVQNDDDACFAWAVVSALYPADENANRMTSYPHYSGCININGIRFPVTLKQVPRFEAQNNVSINIYILEKIKGKLIVLPAYLTKEKKDCHINLLVIQSSYYDEADDDDDDGAENDVDDEPITYHYVWIKSLSRLLSSQVSAHHNAKFFCDRCLHYFYSSIKLDEHTRNCVNINRCKIRMPTDAEKDVSFKNFRNKIIAPFMIYADLECILVKSNDENVYQKHIPYSVGYYVKCAYDPKLSFFKSHRGVDCIKWFVLELNQFAKDVERVFLNPLPMEQMSIQQIQSFTLANTCYICEKTFTVDCVKVRDHCHLTGIYRGPAHVDCNVNFKDTHTIPIIFHNLSGYDSHFILKNLALDLKGRIELLPINKERYISFTKSLDEYVIKYRFIDSSKFMASSLDTLVSYLNIFPILESQFPNLTNSQFNLLTRKGVFPYDYCDDVSKFSVTHLPDITNFYNKLNETDISEEDYAHAQKVWNELNIKNLGEYSDIYLKTDVLLLADVFEQFRASCHKTYGLDPAHYFTLPGYTWDAMLKHTDITLELLTDIDMLMFVERGIRGGLSQCTKRYAKANNKYMRDYDEAQPSKYLMYNDINNQYGWAMSQFLPHSDFHWMLDCNNFNVDTIPDDSDIGYILEVDLVYPSNIYDYHKDLPFCPNHIIPPGSKQKKLLATLNDCEQYIIHYRNLKQALKYGLRLIKIHKILKFRQSPWLKSYIDLNTILRTAAKNEFEKNLFKLMNNAVFGKTMENIRKHSVVKLVTKWFGRYGAEALISKPQCKASTIFGENLIAVELNRGEIFFNKPIYVGMCILDLAKTTIYDFHYGYMAPQFGSKCTVCYTDTDSLIYEVSCSDLYQIIKRDCSIYFDTSDYPIENVWGIPLENKKVLGLMKDENNGRIMTEFVGLRSKMYAIRVEGEDSTKKSKGVKKNIVKTKITFDDYVDCLRNNTEKLVEQNLIRSRKHEVSSITQSKIALSPHHDKRLLIANSVETLPWGHFTIRD